jgi:hypothetical protein
MKKYWEASYRFGLIGGIFSVLAFLVFHWIGQDPTNLSMLFGYVMIPVFIFLGIRFFKKYVNQDWLSFAEGMTIGFLIYTLFAFITAMGIWIILSLNSTLFAELKEKKLDILESNKDMIISQLGQESFETTLAKVQEMVAWDIALNDFIWKMVPGLFFTIIISIILRRTNN